MPLRSILSGIGATLAILVAASAADARSVGRGDPVVISGAALAKLDGATAAELAAFRYRDPKRGKGRWKQIPLQLDERKVVDFGANPPNNAAAGTEGTVYGTTPIGVTALQYADPHTFVGPDPDPGLDADDEVALIAADAGDKAGKRVTRPNRTVGRPTRVKLSDPLGGSKAFVYIFRSRGRLDPTAGKDYVQYEFRLASGDYRTTYKRADGPNPESSGVSTGAYEVGFSDRWYFDALSIGGGPDILDGFKFQFGPTSCGRSEETFNDGEGAFVANIDGPVRAIRSYVGANSGPLTQRTHVFYRDRYEIVTDLRVHAVPGPLTYHDLSPAGIGMTYFNSANQGGASVDGVPDAIDPAVADWHLWSGPQGSLASADRLVSSFGDELLAQGSTWYLDDATPAPNLQCWGDTQALGQAGMRSTAGMPNTDPSTGGTDTLRTTTTDIVGAPGLGPDFAALASQRLDAPLGIAVKTLKP